jgi:SAM-dependent methyltransferase
MTEKEQYWNGFYKQTDRSLLIPSQFATFVASEFVDIVDTIVDLGCGNGRDAFFLSELGFKVIGVDASKEAIEYCSKRSGQNSFFLCSDILDINLLQNLRDFLINTNRLLVYSRFFLHAISEDEELSFWNLVRDLCGLNDFLAVEFRTDRDASLNKVTGKHFRRFIKPPALLERANKFGFVCEYLVEGFGFAKYKTDDAHVARFLLKKIR